MIEGGPVTCQLRWSAPDILMLQPGQRICLEAVPEMEL